MLYLHVDLFDVLSLSLFPTLTYSLRRCRKVEKVKPYGKCQVMAWIAFQSRLLHAGRRPIYIDRMRPGCSGRGRRMRHSISSVQPPHPWSPSVCVRPLSLCNPTWAEIPVYCCPSPALRQTSCCWGGKQCVLYRSEHTVFCVYALKLTEH